MDGIVRQTTAAVTLGMALLANGCGDRRIEGPYGKIAGDAIPRIEEVTGLTFKTDPKIEARSRDEVRSFLERRFREDLPDEEIAGTQSAYRLLGLIPDTMDLRAFMLDLLTEQVVGYYDPETKVLYVVQDAPATQVNLIINHELVHALQDQYMSLDSLQMLRDDNDRQVAAHAVIEGQATLVQIEAMVGPGDVQAVVPGGWDRIRELVREQSASMPVFSTAPRLVQETLLFPYISGAEFMRSFQQLRGGDVPFSDLPRSTEQVMHARAYFQQRDAPTTVTLPNPRVGRSRYQNNLGEFETRLFIYVHAGNQELSVRGADGWDGDRYMVVQTPRGEALVWVAVWDTPVDAAEFTEALDRAISRRFDGERMYEVATGKRYELADREVSWWGGEISGCPAVIYTDAPAGVGDIILPGGVKFRE